MAKKKAAAAPEPEISQAHKNMLRDKMLAKGGKMRRAKINKRKYAVRRAKPKPEYLHLIDKVDTHDEFLAAVTGQGINTLSNVFLHEGKIYMYINTWERNTQFNIEAKYKELRKDAKNYHMEDREMKKEAERLTRKETKIAFILDQDEAKLLGLKLFRLAYGRTGDYNLLEGE